MKFIILKNKIVKILSKIQGITGKSSNLAITENVLIETHSNYISLKATDLETAFEGFCPAKIENSGSIAVNSKKLYEILKEFPDNNIFIEELTNKRIRIGHNNILYDMVGTDAENFPEVVDVNDAVFFQINALTFRDLIKKTTIVSCSVGEKRAHINGVLLEIDNKDDKFLLRMVSTDANRLSIVNYLMKSKSKIKKTAGILIPKKGLNEIIKFIDVDEFLEVGVKDNILVVKKEHEMMVVRLLEGEFPEYKGIVNKEAGTVIKLNKYDFCKTLKRMSILTNERNNGISFTFGDNKMLVVAKNQEYGESKEEVVINYSGQKIEAAFNPKFLLDTLSVMEGDSVFINIIDGNKPCIIEGSDEYSFISVIMPMRI